MVFCYIYKSLWINHASCAKCCKCKCKYAQTGFYSEETFSEGLCGFFFWTLRFPGAVALKLGELAI